MDPDRFSTKSLADFPVGKQIARVMAACIEGVDPYKAIQTHVKRQGSQLNIGNKKYKLTKFNNVFCIGFGKASYPMMRATMDILGDYFTHGIAITKYKPHSMEKIPQNISLYQGSHPIPDLNSLISAEKIIEKLELSSIHDLHIFLISGGGSSLLTAPVKNIRLEDLRNLTSLLLKCGASIDEINCIRKHLSRVKGGGLARLSHPAHAATLILSDVVGDPLDVIASGPTVPDPTTYADAIQILQHYNILQKTPASICGHLRRGANGKIPETPKDDDPIFKNIQNIIVGNNLQAAQAGIRQANQEGFNSLLLTTRLQGEAKEGGSILASIARQISLTGDPVKKPACIICGGETTVKIVGEGFGGRNQEFVLGAVKGLSGLSKTMIISLATDGDDGPTDAAGAVATGKTLERARELGINLDDSLSRNDSYNFFEPLGDLIKTGQTETNVCDLSFIFSL